MDLYVNSFLTIIALITVVAILNTKNSPLFSNG